MLPSLTTADRTERGTRAQPRKASERGGGEPVNRLQVSLLRARKLQERQNNKLYFSVSTKRVSPSFPAMSGSYYRSLYPFSGEQHQQGLSFNAGEMIRVVQALPGGWWEGEHDGHRGWFPSSYVQGLEVSSQIDVCIET